MNLKTSPRFFSRAAMLAALGTTALLALPARAQPSPMDIPPPFMLQGGPMPMPHGHHGGWHHGHGMMGAHSMLFAGANAEQKKQIEAIFAKAHEQAATLHEQATTLHEQMIAEMGKPALDRAALDALFAKKDALHSQIQRLMHTACLDALEKLDAKQRQQHFAQMAKFMAQHKPAAKASKAAAPAAASATAPAAAPSTPAAPQPAASDKTAK